MRELTFSEQLRSSLSDVRETVTTNRLSDGDWSTLSSFKRLLIRANISLSPITYIALCLFAGTILLGVCIRYGLIFGVFISLFATYELLVCVPHARASRRAERMASQLPALLESLGYHLKTGLSLESAIVKSIYEMPDGELTDTLQGIIRNESRGATLEEGLSALCVMWRIPDLYLFSQALRIFGSRGMLYGDAFVRLAMFLRDFRQSLTRLHHRAQAQRICYLLFIVTILSGAGAGFSGFSHLLASVNPSVLELVRQLGASIIVTTVLFVLRITSVGSLEGYDQF